jgi:hypothetical protein
MPNNNWIAAIAPNAKPDPRPACSAMAHQP